jgi:hypothetical protein
LHFRSSVQEKVQIEIVDLGLCIRHRRLDRSILKIHFSVEATKHDFEAEEFPLVDRQLLLVLLSQVWTGFEFEAICNERDLIGGVLHAQY